MRQFVRMTGRALGKSITLAAVTVCYAATIETRPAPCLLPAFLSRPLLA
jgi:hypothetical protein